MKILEYLDEKKKLVKRLLIKKLGGITTDEIVEKRTVEFLRNEKDILTLKATTWVEVEDLSGDEVGDIHMKYVKDDLSKRLLDELRRSHMIHYSTGEESFNGDDISVSATIRVVKP